MATVSSRDIQEIVSKLSSDKARTREEGIKLLNTWLEGGRLVDFCRRLHLNTAALKPNEIPHAETWPFLVTLLIDCVVSEISSNKRRVPKIMYARSLRSVVQQAVDQKGSCDKLPLTTVVKSLFSHVWDVLREVPSFQSEYAVILRHLLAVKDYRFHMRKKVYCGLLLLYMEKIEASLSQKSSSGAYSEASTLHSLLENPPGDFSESTRDAIVRGFITIFASLSLREVGKISKKLIECLNTYLAEDGPNLGSRSLEIHDSVQQYVFHCWLTALDQSVKDTMVIYASLQLKLMRDSENGGALVEQILDAVRRELDQNCVPNSGAARLEAAKDEKYGTLTSSQQDLVDLAALVFYRACKHTNEERQVGKRAKREQLSGYLKAGLIKGNCLWHAAFCFLIKNYHTRIGENLLACWSDAICSNFERIMNDANTKHSYDGLLWTLRSLQELCTVLIPKFAVEKNSLKPSLTSNKISLAGKTLWSCVLRGLPTFSNITPVVDAAFILLSTLVSNDLLNIMIVPNEVWDLKCFKNITSVSVLYFISCYFSRKGLQGDLRDNLQLRKNIMRRILDFVELKGSFTLDKDLVILLPGSILALCAGTFIIPDDCKMFFAAYAPIDAYGGKNFCDGKPKGLEEHVEICSDVLTEVNLPIQSEVSSPQDFQSVHLPKLLKDSLLHEMENGIYVLIDKLDKKSLSDIFLHCALMSYLLDGSFKARLRDEASSFRSTIYHHLLDLMRSALLTVQELIMDVKSHGCWSSIFAVNMTYSAAVSLNIFLQCPFFIRSNGNATDCEIYGSVVDSIEKFLKCLYTLYLECSQSLSDQESETTSMGASSSSYPVEGASSLQNTNSSIVDIDLDQNVESATGLSFSGIRWKMDMVSLIESCFPILPAMAWDVLFEILKKEDHSKVCQSILLSLCENPHWSSSERLLELVTLINKMIELRLTAQLHYFDIVATISCLLRNLLFLHSPKKGDHCHPSLPEQDFVKSLECLRNQVDQISGSKLLDWRGRVKLTECMCNFIRLNPAIGQAMIENLFIFLHDDDYRVRLYLARQIGVPFETWDGHDELFQDICFNFGIKLLVPSKEKLVTVAEVLADGPHLSPIMETVIITLMQIALYSEKMEFQAVFMICTISAIYPSQRELVKRALDNLAKQLQYACRSKYLDELMRCILFWWVHCGVSLPALVEMRDLFVLDVEVKHFIQYCCPWLLSSLMLHDDASNLAWIAQVTGEPIHDLLQNHFVPVFSICMTLHCSKKPGWDKALLVLQNSYIRIAKITEDERDKLIKKHLVSIVSFILGLSSCSPDSPAPFFSSETVQSAIRSVVDGFLDVEDCQRNTVVVDKINIFRPDRVFTLIVEMHYRITAAVNQRHRCHRLSGIEALIDILGHRVTVASTSCYLINLAGQFISCHTLQDQCCRMLSTLLQIYKNNPSRDSTDVFGEQLQFLVSRLVVCCIPSDSAGQHVIKPASEVLSLLHLLTVDADPSLHDYIRELEPFPELDIFDRIRMFHLDLCNDQSPRDQFLKFVKRSRYLPPRILLWSLQALHSRLLGEIFCAEENTYSGSGKNYNEQDNEVVEAVWSLVHMCGSSDAEDIQALVADFISRVGIEDPHSTVFHLPGNIRCIHVCEKSSGGPELNMNAYSGVPEELLILLMRILKKYLIDDSVQIVDLASQTLRGILSTERGQRALLSFDSYEKSLLAVHSKGVSEQMVQHCLHELERKFFADGKSLDDSALWSTIDKDFETWICPLVYSLIGYCDDTMLQLCQDIVLLKAEFAELLLPNVMVNLAGKMDSDVNLCKMISLQVQENIFVETNMLIKSIQATLNALNEVRVCHVIESSRSSTTTGKQSSKFNRLSAGHNSRSSKVKDFAATLNAISTSAWDKVYWLSIDYLIVAKAAITCGSYFTSVMYVEHWCEENFNNLTLGDPDFSHRELLPHHVDILLAAITKINEPDSLYGIIQSHKLNSQIVTFEHENNWSKALQYYDLQVRSASLDNSFKYQSNNNKQLRTTSCTSSFISPDETVQRKPYKGLIRSLQQTGCAHILDLYSQGLVSQNSEFQQDLEFVELQYEAAWRAGNWDYSFLYLGAKESSQYARSDRFHGSLHSCLRALHEGDPVQFQIHVRGLKQGLVLSIHHASEESTEYIYAAIIKLQILDHLTMAWDLRWKSYEKTESNISMKTIFSTPNIPTLKQLSVLDTQWRYVLKQTQMNMNLLEPFVAFRRVLLQVLGCKDSILQHLLKSSAVLRKGSRFPQAASALQDFKFISLDSQDQLSSLYWLGRLEEAKFLRAQGQFQMAINLGKHLVEHNQLNEERSDVYRLVGKWLAETRSSNSRTILEEYLKPAVLLAGEQRSVSKKTMARQCRTYFQLAHYADALFKSHDERLNSSEWQAAMRLRKHKTLELEALVKRLKSTAKGQKIDYSIKIQELQKQLMLDKEEAEKLQVDRDKVLDLALDGYKRCLVVGDKYDVRVVFRLISLWFSLSSRHNVVNSMLSTIKEVQSRKFIPLVYQIASRMGGGPKEVQGPGSFQFALVSLVKKMAIDHPYHTVLQLLALANGDRIKDKQRSRNSFVVDMDKKRAAEKLLEEISDYHGPVIKQMKLMVEAYIKLAELETKREDTNKKISLPRDIRSLRQLELVPVVTANFPVDPSCQYHEGSFPHFMGLADSVTIMNGINAPKVVECFGSDGKSYRQLAKSGNDDLRQDAVMEQFFSLVNTFLQNNRDTWRRKLGVRTYKVVPFTPSAGVIEWVNGTLPLGEYLIGSTRSGGAHGRYGAGDWSFPKCREHMMNAKEKRRAFQEVCDKFRPVMHHFFLERFWQPADWFEKRLAYIRSVAASSMVGYIVGLGDRHSMNILIDQATAEVVHIDLGVAFEQGLMLKTPERVPFRLTRDIIDGMGATGIEGVFRRCSEETLSVMRTNKEALLTIIEVFIHDPLYKWALSPLKALQRQNDMDDDLETTWEDSQDDHEGNKDAARALLRVKQKLDGFEEGEMRSVHGQVQQLIQDAIDPERLCQMFPGWGSWM